MLVFSVVKMYSVDITDMTSDVKRENTRNKIKNWRIE